MEKLFYPYRVYSVALEKEKVHNAGFLCRNCLHSNDSCSEIGIFSQTVRARLLLPIASFSSRPLSLTRTHYPPYRLISDKGCVYIYIYIPSFSPQDGLWSANKSVGVADTAPKRRKIGWWLLWTRPAPSQNTLERIFFCLFTERDKHFIRLKK